MEGRRLVEDENFRVHRKGAGDLHDLHLRRAESLDAGVGRQVEAGDSHGFSGALYHPLPIYRTEVPGRQIVDADIFRDRERRDQIALLMDDSDARVEGLPHVRENYFLASDPHDALVVPDHSGDDIDQGRLARAVLSDKGQDLSLSKVEGDIVEGPNAWEALPYTLHRQNYLALRHAVPPVHAALADLARLIPATARMTRPLMRSFQ